MYERILVPLDGSTVAEIALDHAAAFARLLKSELILLQVLAPVFQRDSLAIQESDSPFELDTQQFERERVSAEEYLGNLSGRFAQEGIKSEAVTTLGEVAAEIAKYARSADISLIVMSTHGRGGLSRPRLGSVAQNVLHESAIPVLVLPHP